jgi:hemerythrin-like domain-containing protein
MLPQQGCPAPRGGTTRSLAQRSEVRCQPSATGAKRPGTHVMTEVIAALRKEHANIAQLLDILDRQVTIFDRGGSPDYGIVEGIVDYFQSYPDLYHHPKEDLVYQKLELRDPAAARRVGNLRQEHEELAARTREFAAAVRAVLDEAQVSRASFGQWARRFIQFQRDHMTHEERFFLPAARAALTPEDWDEIRERATDQEDPLFGEEVGGRYEALRRDILEWERESGGA